MSKRPTHTMPDDVANVLDTHGVRGAYGDRPAYQRNDYIGWITGAKRPATRAKRIAQMADELKRGGVYMKAAWSGAGK